jgi:hypothetical protein
MTVNVMEASSGSREMGLQEGFSALNVTGSRAGREGGITPARKIRIRPYTSPTR